MVESGSSAKPIDWASWDARISNKEVLGCLKSSWAQVFGQSSLLFARFLLENSLLSGDLSRFHADLALGFHEQQSSLLEQVLKEDHAASATRLRVVSNGYMP